MRRQVLASSRAAALCACAVLSAALAGCSAAASNNSVTVTGTTLTIYASAPSAAVGGVQPQDVVEAEQLALSEAGGHAGKLAVTLKQLPAANTLAQVTANARTAIQDSSAIAYLGELVPGYSAGSLGITNAQDVLQVSPTDTALELTQPTPAVPNSPTRYYESLKTYGRTFGRVVPTTALEAKAQVQEMQALHVTHLYVADDGQHYGDAIAFAVRRAAQSAGITVGQGAPTDSAFSASGADALFYGGSSESDAARLFGSVSAASATAKLFGPSTLDDSTFAAALSPAAARNVYVSSPGFLAKDLPALGHQFMSSFQARYGHSPSLVAVFGYTAMKAVLQAINSASPANNRSAVVKAFFGLKSFSSAVGTFSINVNGDAVFAPSAPFVIAHVRAGALVPFKFVPVPQG